MTEISQDKADGQEAAPEARGSSVLATIVQTQPVRYALIVLWALGLAGTLGFRLALGWCVATLVAGAVRGWAEGRLAARAANRLGPIFTLVAVFTGCFWAAAPLLAWFSHAPFGQPLAALLLASGYFLVFTQLRDSPAQAVAVSTPYTAVAVVMGASLWGRPEFWSYAAALPFLWAVLAVHVLLSLIIRSKLQTSSDRQARLIQELQQARQAADAANEAKSGFLATMSHEIRTPLNGVLGMAQAIERDELSDTQRERVAVLRGAGETLLTLLNDMLDLSRIEAGRMELEDGSFDIVEIATGAKATFEFLAANKNLYLEAEFAPEAYGHWRGDPTRVRQIVYNLVSNAVKFTDAGSVRLAASVEDGQLVLKVSDTGAGIPADRLGLLFNKFVQADASTTRRYGGSGLGLSISRDLARLMKGDIDVESTEGQGSCFTIRLPASPVSEPGAKRVAEAESALSVEQPGNLRVLAAEDNPVNQLVLSTLLSQAGIDVQMVANGQEALEAFEAGTWDVVLMDVHMPVLDGVAATLEIRRREQLRGGARTPIIALTANAMSHQMAEYREAGMDGVVAKPIEFAKLLAEVARVLDAPGDAAEPPLLSQPGIS